MATATPTRLGLMLCLLVSAIAMAQPLADGFATRPAISWTPFGNTQVLAGVAGYASGPVDRVWRNDAGVVRVALEGGAVWGTRDFSVWSAADATAVPDFPVSVSVPNPPVDAWLVLAHPMQASLVYAVGNQVYQSLDGGRTFAGLTRYRGVSLLGESIRDLLLNDQDPDDLMVATELGLWRSRDGGLSWFPASTSLDNLPLRRIAAFPEGRRGLIVEQPGGALLEWVPGSVNGWRPRSMESGDAWVKPPSLAIYGANLAAWDAAEGKIYAGLQDGRLLASADQGVTWTEYSLPGWGPPKQILVNPADPQLALALSTDDTGRPILLRTLNGGLFWEDLTPQRLPTVDAIAADWEQNTMLLAAPDALLLAAFDFRGMAGPAPLRRIRWEGMRGELRDLRIDPSGTLLFAVTSRAGVYFAPLPVNGSTHRVRHAADLSSRPAAPGDLLSIHGAPLPWLRANRQDVAVLASADQGTQVQLPYSLATERSAVELEFDDGSPRRLSLPLRRVSPAVFLHPDGSPFVLHADTGALIDENLPAVPGERIQVMVSGLGAVRPDWPAGLPVPAEAPPAVVASVEARLNGSPVQVERATLAPGYAGIYLVELVLPAVMDDGLAELLVLADGVPSNTAALHVAYR